MWDVAGAVVTQAFLSPMRAGPKDTAPLRAAHPGVTITGTGTHEGEVEALCWVFDGACLISGA